MRVRVDDIFVMKFALELERLETNVAGHEDYDTHKVPLRLAVEEFLTAMAPALAEVLKFQLLDVLLADAARFAQEKSSSTPIPLDAA